MRPSQRECVCRGAATKVRRQRERETDRERQREKESKRVKR